ncbi:MAG TPA: phytanoyl-CoA dioxygenase family protein [Planctomycetota bacterium]|nr:phytanoyl-CoA dioxygenase family protein [Planctomycetota bacterium]
MSATLAPTETLAEQYARNGFCFVPDLLPRELIERVIPHMDAVIDGHYETGVPAKVYCNGDDPRRIRKIDMTHLSDRTIYELVTHPAIGKLAAAVTGAKMVQLWASQLLFKPPGGVAKGNVGWHQDKQYWKYWQGEGVFTIWIAISDVKEESGPMKYVRGSHRLGLAEVGDFFDPDMEKAKAAYEKHYSMPWDEVSAILPPGGVAMHHCYTIHGSGPNVSNLPRRSFALHLRNENSTPVPGNTDYFVSHLDDRAYSPVIYSE